MRTSASCCRRRSATSSRPGPRAALAVALVLAGAQSAFATPAAFALPAAIRVGGPSAPGDPKVAIVASGANLGGERFSVSGRGGTVLRGTLQRAPGSAAPWGHGFRADLSRIHRPGRYRVHAAGILSRPWVVRRGGSRPQIGLILRFFRTNRDGSEPALLHVPAHLHDAVVRGGARKGEHIDLTGGWMDAGDTIHFTQNAAYATAALEAAARLDPADGAALRREADVGIRWLLKAHPAPDLFVTQVGDGRDHDRGFRDPAGDDSSPDPGIGTRLAYHWGSGVGGDIGGKAAEALAMAAGRTPAGPGRAALISQAEEWYEAGRESARATPALPGAGGFYVVSGWKDSLAAGAAALHRATGGAGYLADALRYLRGSEPDDLIGYSNVAPLAAADICGRLGAPALGSASQRRAACAFLRRSGGQGFAYARADPLGPAGYISWGTTAANGAGGAIALISGLPGARRVAAGARDWLFGRNAWGASLVTGYGPHRPRRIHSWASVFGEGLPSGAVVGGPAPLAQVRGQGLRPAGPLRSFNSDVVYEDRRDDYVTSEPAIDYAASSILLLAALAR